LPAESVLPRQLRYLPGFLPPADASAALDRLWRELEWEQREITLFGRRMLQPRLIAWYGDRGARYRYSGLTLSPRAWHPLLQALKARVEDCVGSPFNSVLANAYRDGQDSMGWHSDDEKELGADPVIASLSLGAPRRFLIRAKNRPTSRGSGSSALLLEHGSLLVMEAGCQQRYQHSLPRTRRAVGLRINLTFRMVRVQVPD
jgi:alkylated DNA repair dioxygenase AlkB